MHNQIGRDDPPQLRVFHHLPHLTAPRPPQPGDNPDRMGSKASSLPGADCAGRTPPPEDMLKGPCTQVTSDAPCPLASIDEGSQT